MLLLDDITQQRKWNLRSNVVIYNVVIYNMPRRAKVVNVLAVRQVKQGTETTRFRTDSTPHPCQYVHM